MENLGIDIKLLFAQLLNFLVFYFVFKKFISKPFFAYLNNEQKKDEQKEILLKKLQEGETVLDEREKEMKKKIKEEREEIVAKAKQDAEKVKENLVAQAQKEADQTVIKAKEHINAEREAMVKDVKNQVISVSNLIVQKGLEDFLTLDAQKQVTQNVLKHLPEKF